MSCAHGPAFCCTRCTSTSDGRGFPHPMVAGERRRLQQCPLCLGWFEPEEWVHDIAGARFGCIRCLPPER